MMIITILMSTSAEGVVRRRGGGVGVQDIED